MANELSPESLAKYVEYLHDMLDQMGDENYRLWQFWEHCHERHSLPDCCCPDVEVGEEPE